MPHLLLLLPVDHRGRRCHHSETVPQLTHHPPFFHFSKDSSQFLLPLSPSHHFQPTSHGSHSLPNLALVPKRQLVLALKGAAPLDSLACARRLTLTTCPPVPEQRRRPPPLAMPPSTTLLCTTVSCKVGEGTPLWQSQIYLAAAVPSPSLHLSRSRYCFNQLAIRSDDSQEFGSFFLRQHPLHFHVILYRILVPNHSFSHPPRPPQPVLKAVQTNNMSIDRRRLGGKANYLYLAFGLT